MLIEPAIRDLLRRVDLVPRPASDSVVDHRSALGQVHTTVLSQLPPYPPVEGVTVREQELALDDRTLGLRVFTPAGDGPLPVLVYFFGGAWWLRTFDAADIMDACAHIAGSAGVIVVEVDYRLAPEHPYPAAVDDGEAVVRWLAGSAADLGCDPRRIAVGGQSSGANIAAALCLRLRDRQGPAVGLQVLEVPVLDLTRSRQSDDGLEPFVSDDDGLARAIGYYLGEGGRATDPIVSPLLAADLTGLPPALILAAELDPLRAEAMDYAERLREAGVEAVAATYTGQVHLTPSLRTLVRSGRAWRDQVAQAVREWAWDR